MSELLPCPFCGAQPEHDFFPISHYPHELYCDKCIGVVATQKKTFDEAAAAWNRRTPTIPPDVRETLRGALQLSGGYLSGDIPPYSSKWGLTDIDAALSWLDAQGGGRNG